MKTVLKSIVLVSILSSFVFAQNSIEQNKDGTLITSGQVVANKLKDIETIEKKRSRRVISEKGSRSSLGKKTTRTSTKSKRA